jgi:hypothetical protein
MPMKAPKRCVRRILFHTIIHYFFVILYFTMCEHRWQSTTNQKPKFEARLQCVFCLSMSTMIKTEASTYGAKACNPALMCVFMSISKTTTEIMVIMHVFVNRSVINKTFTTYNCCLNSS